MTNDQKQRAVRLWCALDELIKEMDDCNNLMSKTKADDNGFSVGFTMGQVVHALNVAKEKARTVLSEETE